MISYLDCKIEILCAVNPSESQQKVEKAITNIFPDCTIKNNNYSLTATSNKIKSLEQIHKSIQFGQSQKTYRRALVKHTNKNMTWFYLNKQAAFANKVAICEEADESPLGPIKVILFSNTIPEIIKWLTKTDQEN